MALPDIPAQLHELYEIHEWRHASAVLINDFPVEWKEVCEVLTKFRLLKSSFAVKGGNLSPISAALDLAFKKLGWKKRTFDTEIHVDDRVEKSPTHEVDCFKGKVGLEVEWNNKDPFFDRDLNNFRLLSELRALSVGIIITRCDELNAIAKRLGKEGFSANTTHMGQLLPRLKGGGGGGCPVLIFGIREACYVENVPDLDTPNLIAEFTAARESKGKTRGPTLLKYFDGELLAHLLVKPKAPKKPRQKKP